MTSRERLLAALGFRESDRVPIELDISHRYLAETCRQVAEAVRAAMAAGISGRSTASRRTRC